MSSAAELLAEFSGNGNVNGVRLLLELGADVDSQYNGDSYFGISSGSTALHVAAWKLNPNVVKLLIENGADVNALDSRGMTPLMLAVKACVDSHWTLRRSPEIVEDLLRAGASREDIDLPCGYYAVDSLLKNWERT